MFIDSGRADLDRGCLDLGGLTSPGHANAQARPADAAAAQALFDEARALVKGGKAAEACPKFEESEPARRRGPGTELQLPRRLLRADGANGERLGRVSPLRRGTSLHALWAT